MGWIATYNNMKQNLTWGDSIHVINIVTKLRYLSATSQDKTTTDQKLITYCYKAISEPYKCVNHLTNTSIYDEKSK